MPAYHGPCKAPGEHKPPGCMRGRMKRACPFGASPPPADSQPTRPSPRGSYRNDGDQASTSYDTAGTAYCYSKGPQDDALRQASRLSSYSTPRVPQTECAREQLDCQKQQQRSASTPCLRRPVSLDIPIQDVCSRPRNAAAGPNLRPRGAGRKFAAASLSQNPSRPPRCKLVAAEPGRAPGSGEEASHRVAEGGPNGEHCQLTNLRFALNDKEMQLVELRDQHVELVNRSAEARENYEEAIRCKDNVIQQLQEVINGKKALFCRDQEVLQRTVREQRTELEKKDMDVASMQAKLSHHVQDLLEQQRTIDNLNSQLFGQEKERANQSNCLFLELEDMSGRLQDLETRLQDKDEVIESQRICCQELKSLVWKRECRIAQLQLSEQQLQSNLVKQNSVNEDLEYNREQLEMEKSATEKMVCELRHEISSLEAAGGENAELLKQDEDCISRMQCEIADLRAELQAKEAALDSELGGQSRLQDEHQKMLEEYDCLRLQYDHLKSEHDHYRSEYEEVREEYRNLKVQCDLMRGQVETLDFKQQQLDAARAQNEQMRLSLKTAQERLTALQLTISEAERTACMKRSTSMDVFTNDLYETDCRGDSLPSPSKCVYHSPRGKVCEEQRSHLPACSVLSKPYSTTPVHCSPKTCSVPPKPCCSPLCSPKPCPALSKPCSALIKPAPASALSSPKIGPNSKPWAKSTKFGQSVKMTKSTTPRGKVAEGISSRKPEAEQKRVKHDDIPSSSKHPWPCRKLETAPASGRGPLCKQHTAPSHRCCASPQRSQDGSLLQSREASPSRFGFSLSRKPDTRNVGYCGGSKQTSTSRPFQPDMCPVCQKQVEPSKQGSYYKRSEPTCCCNVQRASQGDSGSDQELKNLQEEIFNRERGWRHTEAKMRAELCRRLEQIHDTHYQNNACKRSYARSYIQSQVNKSSQRPQSIMQQKKASHCPCPS